MRKLSKKRIFVVFALFLFGILVLEITAHQVGTDRVRLSGYALENDNGQFLALGATYLLALKHMKDDPTLVEDNVDFLSRQGFDYIRILSMVKWGEQTILPPGSDPNHGEIWDKDTYRDTLHALIDLVDYYGMRVQITIFAGTAITMTDRTARDNHVVFIRDIIKGWEGGIILLEVANEYYHETQCITRQELVEHGNFLAASTDVLVALSAPPNGKSGICATYTGGVGIDIATVHFTRTGDWVSVYDCLDAYKYICGLPVKISSNEPIGPGSSVRAECDPVKILMGPVIAWHSKLPMYVFHSKVGIQGWEYVKNDLAFNCDILPQPLTFAGLFDKMGLTGKFQNLKTILPRNLPNWEKIGISNSGSPFSDFSGAYKCTSSVSGNKFITFVSGVVAGGAVLKAGKNIYSLKVYNPAADTAQPLSGFPSCRLIGNELTLPGYRKAAIISGRVGVPLPPIPIWPKNNNFVNTLTPLLKWNAAESDLPVTGYKIRVYAGNNQVILSPTPVGNVLEYRVPVKLQCNRTYKWQVRAKIGCVSSPWSEWAFFRAPMTPTKPTNLTPRGGAITGLTPTLCWDPVNVYPAVDQYQVQVVRTDTGDNVEDVIIPEPCYTIPAGVLEPCSTRYKWRVRAHNNNPAACPDWGNWSDYKVFYTDTVPAAPAPIRPTNNQITNMVKPVFEWNPAQSKIPVTNYRVRILDQNGNVVYGPISVGNVTKWQIPDKLDCDKRYSWQVSAYNVCGWGLWSSPAYFRTPQIPYAPTNLTPGGGTETGKTPTLQWTAVNVTPNVDKYHIEVYENNIHGPIVFSNDNVVGTSYQIPPGILNGATRYTWRVRAHNNNPCTPWGPWSEYKIFYTR